MSHLAATWVPNFFAKQARFGSEEMANRAACDVLKFKPSSPCLGVYRNSGDDDICFFEEGLSIGNDRYVIYDDIVKVDLVGFSAETKTSITSLCLGLSDGSDAKASMIGIEDGKPNIYSLFHFLLRICPNV